MSWWHKMMHTWQMKKLSSLVHIVNGYAFKSKNYVEKGIRIIRIANVQDGYICDEHPCYYPSNSQENLSQFMLYENDLLLSLTGNVGRVAMITKSMLPAALNQRVCCIRPISSKIKNDFLYFYLLRQQFKKDCIAASNGVAQLNLSTKWLENYLIPVPPLEEQSRIVSRIEEMISQLDSGVEALKQTKAQLAVYRQAVVKEAFSSITNGKQVTLCQCLVDKPRNGYSPKAVNYPTKYKNLTLTATTSGRFIEDCFKYIDIQIDDNSYLWVKHNDILIQRANTLEYVGTAVVYTGEDDKYVYPDLMMKCRTINDINPHYIVYQLQSQSTRQYYRRNATGTAGSMPKINQSVVMNTPIIITNNIEQNEIVKSIEAKFSVCDQIEKSIDIALQQAEALRQSILKKAFEGDL